MRSSFQSALGASHHLYYSLYDILGAKSTAIGVRTVRLDDEAERVLKQVGRAMGLSISAALKKCLLALRDETARQAGRGPFEIYRELDLGPGGYAIAPSTQARRGVHVALKRKHRR